MGVNTLITVDPKQKPFNNTILKFESISEKLGDIIYGEWDFSRLKIFLNQYIKPKTKPKEKGLVDIINSSIKKEKTSRKIMGMGLLLVTIITIMTFILYIIYYIFSTLLDIMEWWMLAIIFMMIVVPGALIIAYWVAKGDY